jgi:hypothetical protein
MMKVVEQAPCEELTPMKRPHYFEGQLLTTQDFQAEQSYFQGKGRQHQRYLHGYGVVCGLRVVPAGVEKPRAVMVEPGLALDSWGREIVVSQAMECDLGARGCRDNLKPSGQSDPLYVVLSYREAPSDIAPVPTEPGPLESEASSMPSRIVESFHLEVRSTPPEVGEGMSEKFCQRLSDAIRQGAGAERLHRLLSELISQPCRPCAEDPALTLARIDLPARGELTEAGIDNHSYRRLALATERIYQLLLCMMSSLGQ